jgi:hypothetical protein
MKSSVGVNLQGRSAEKVKLLLNSRNTALRETQNPLLGALNIEVVFMTLSPALVQEQSNAVLSLVRA